MARQLVGEGASVSLLARDAGELARAAADLRQRGGTVLTLTGDVGQRERAESAVEQTVAHFGRLDVLINNAGMIQMGPLENTDPDDYAQAMAVHFWGPLYTTRAALPYLRKQPGARVVNIASYGGKLAMPHLAPYCSSKFALTGLSYDLRTELARYGIPVTTVCPGLMRTGAHLHGMFKGQQRKEYFLLALAMSVPLLSTSAETSARKILRACRRGSTELVFSLPFSLATRLAPLCPRLTAGALRLLARLLPGPAGPEGNVALPGLACRPAAPSPLTALADRAAQANNELPTSLST
jgi:NAD(P)-dependent dehydrogenase (short-subunit alcohol dehydrogenase family)